MFFKTEISVFKVRICPNLDFLVKLIGFKDKISVVNVKIYLNFDFSGLLSRKVLMFSSKIVFLRPKFRFLR